MTVAVIGPHRASPIGRPAQTRRCAARAWGLVPQRQSAPSPIARSSTETAVRQVVLLELRHLCYGDAAYDHEGDKRTVIEVEADEIGPSLR